EETDRVKAFGLLRVGINVGWAGGAAAGGVVVYHFGYATAFIIPAAGSLAGCLMAWTMLGGVRPALADKPFKLAGLFAPGGDRRMLAFCLASLPLLLLVGQFMMTLSVFAKQRVGLDNTQVGWLYAINGAIIVLVQWPMTFLVERVGLRTSLIAGGLLYAGGYWCLGFAGGLIGMMIAMLVISFGEVTYNPAMQTVVAEIAPPGKTGRYMGFYGLAEAIGWGAGPFLGGMLWDAVGQRHALYLWAPLASLGVVTAIAYRLVLPGAQRGRRQDSLDAGQTDAG
ncbi:MAG: MFS transporter, partial [Planctomycetota bacterium]